MRNRDPAQCRSRFGEWPASTTDGENGRRAGRIAADGTRARFARGVVCRIRPGPARRAVPTTRNASAQRASGSVGAASQGAFPEPFRLGGTASRRAGMRRKGPARRGG
ncbi:hypothetical protein [Halohasta litorea]|uniref:Uncharacterized protein n=1 Tax=Halohasta litorea TaxID=869891 RepID=A0ABD6DDW6_9EURY|nr:hypothetical protein [Halohasta litorea]